jgi:hypothetical protein
MTEVIEQVVENPVVEVTTIEPSQLEGTLVSTVVESPVEAQPEPKPEFVYKYQPVDDLGRPLGAAQVFKGADATEVLDKVAKAHQESIKLNRELNRNLRLGNIEQDVIPEELQRYSDPVEFSPRQLTEEEKVQLSRDMLDPEKFDEASDRLLEAKIGANPKVISQVLTETTQAVEAMQAREEASKFVNTTPDYYICPDNFLTMTNWMLKNNLRPTANNFKFAFEQLKAVGLLLEAPILREEVPVNPQPEKVVVEEQIPANSQPEPDNTSRITSNEPQPQPKRTVSPIASGLTRETTSDVGVSSSQSNKLSVAEIEKMPSEVYKKRLMQDKTFAKQVDEAYAEEARRRQAR